MKNYPFILSLSTGWFILTEIFLSVLYYEIILYSNGQKMRIKTENVVPLVFINIVVTDISIEVPAVYAELKFTPFL